MNKHMSRLVSLALVLSLLFALLLPVYADGQEIVPAEEPSASTESEQHDDAEETALPAGAEPVPSGDAEPVTPNDEESVPPAGAEPVPSGDAEPVTPNDEESVPSAGAEPVPSGDAEPVTPNDEESVPSAGAETVSPASEETASSDQEEAPAAQEEQPVYIEDYAEEVLSGGLLQTGSLPQAADTGIQPLDLNSDVQTHAASDLSGAAAALLSGMENWAARIDLGPYAITVAEFDQLWEDTINNAPQLFYVLQSSYSYSTQTGLISTVTIIYNPAYTQADAAAFNAAVNEAMKCVNDQMTPLEKALALHDYLAVHNSYDFTLNKFDAYNALVQRSSVCQGYTLAYKLLMQKCGIPCQIVTSKDLNHAWNIIQLDGNWYHVDVTWDDATPDITGHTLHKNFLRSEAGIIATGHTKTDWTTPYPCSDTRYDSGAFWSTSNTAVIYEGNTAYYIDSEEGALRRRTSDGAETTLFSDFGVWPTGTGAFWNGIYSGLTRAGNALYFNTVDQVYSLDLGTMEIAEFELSQKPEQQLYGCYYANGQLELADGNNPNVKPTVITVPLQVPEEPATPEEPVTPEKPATPEEPAAPEQTAGELLAAIQNDSSNTAAAEKLIQSYRDDLKSNVSEAAAKALRDVLKANGKEETAVLSEGVPASVSVTVWHSKERPFLQVFRLTTVAQKSLEIDVGYSDGHQSPLGAYLTIYVPEAFDPLATYQWSCGEQTGAVSVISSDGNGITFGFFAPHFSIYKIEVLSSPEVPDNDPASPEDSTPAPSTSTSTSASAASAPVLKATGADMECGPVLLILVLAGAMVLGSAVVLKKRGQE